MGLQLVCGAQVFHANGRHYRKHVSSGEMQAVPESPVAQCCTRRAGRCGSVSLVLCSNRNARRVGEVQCREKPQRQPTVKERSPFRCEVSSQDTVQPAGCTPECGTNNLW